MSNLFQEVLTNAQGVENKLLGPSYPYYKNIKYPSQIGMGSQGSIQQMAKDIDGLIQTMGKCIWDDKPDNIKRARLNQPYENRRL